MGDGFRIRPTDVRAGSRFVKPTTVDDSVHVSFNFKNLTQKTDKFKYSDQRVNYFIKLLQRLVDVCKMPKHDLILRNANGLRCHPIDFVRDNVSERTFGLGQDIDDDAWQFQISSNQHGRVHGYFVTNVFYIVWLDPMHELYPGEL